MSKVKEIKKESDLDPKVIKYLKNVKKTLLSKRSFRKDSSKYHLEDDYNIYMAFEVYHNGTIESIGYNIDKNDFIKTFENRINEATESKAILKIKYIVRFIININFNEYLYGPLKVSCIINKVEDGILEEEPFKIGTIYYTNDELLSNKFNIRYIEVLMNALLDDKISSNPIDINTFTDLLNIKNSNKKVKEPKVPKESKAPKAPKESKAPKAPKEPKVKEPKETKKKMLSTTKVLTPEQIKSLDQSNQNTQGKKLNDNEQSKLFRLILGYALDGEFSERSKPIGESYVYLFSKIKSYIRSLFKKIKGKHFVLKSDSIPDKYLSRKEKWSSINSLINELYNNNTDNKLFINLKNHFNKLDKEYHEEKPEDFLNITDDEKRNIIIKKQKESEELEEKKERLKFEKEMKEAERQGIIEREKDKELNKIVNLKNYKEEYKKLKRKIREENETGGAPKKMIIRYNELKQLIEENKNDSTKNKFSESLLQKAKEEYELTKEVYDDYMDKILYKDKKKKIKKDLAIENIKVIEGLDKMLKDAKDKVLEIENKNDSTKS
jgi:hypothetical protein